MSVERPAPPPVEDLIALLDLALRGDLLGIEAQAAQIEEQPTYQAFARKLQPLAAKLDDELVITFIEQYLK